MVSNSAGALVEQLRLAEPEDSAVERAVPVVDLALAVLPVADHADQTVAAGQRGAGVLGGGPEAHGHLLLGPQSPAALVAQLDRPVRRTRGVVHGAVSSPQTDGH